MVDEMIYERLAGSKFRSRFNLSKKDKDYFADKGREKIREHACDFVAKRLSPAYPSNDGKQTPMKGHPVFIAQHATATCCRGCLAKWHGIPEDRELTETQQDYVVNVIMGWIDREVFKDYLDGNMENEQLSFK